MTYKVRLLTDNKESYYTVPYTHVVIADILTFQILRPLTMIYSGICVIFNLLLMLILVMCNYVISIINLISYQDNMLVEDCELFTTN